MVFWVGPSQVCLTGMSPPDLKAQLVNSKARAGPPVTITRKPTNAHNVRRRGSVCLIATAGMLFCGKHAIVKETRVPLQPVLGGSSASGPPVLAARRWRVKGALTR